MSLLIGTLILCVYTIILDYRITKLERKDKP